MTGLATTGLRKSFGAVDVLRGVDLDVPAGGLTAILGPSGCGKTTLLRLIAGFDAPDSGQVTIGGAVVADGRRGLPPERRGIGFVPQEGGLFPHLTVAGNITFGLSWRARRRRDRVEDLLTLLGLDPSFADRYPHQLSGGQQQRVAVARALAPGPPIVLLDEPFSALDAGLRAETRQAVSEALATTGITAVLVTHDQAEALSMARQVAVMRDGRLIQHATPAEVYATPADLGVAAFVGDSVQLPAVVSDRTATCSLGSVPITCACADGPATLLLRPEQIVIHTDGPGAAATVEGSTFYGHDALVALRLAGDEARVTARCSGRALPAPGIRVTLSVEGGALAFPAAAATHVDPPLEDDHARSSRRD
ncbi:MAG TPA: ABC transporter ATP-binding protein [Mycobacteriales bacterium]